ncbi:hypothetical protein LQW54_002641 [Pestalotiopsis sp. IQ-011]
MASITDPVTIDRAYFDTLVRRASRNDGNTANLSDSNLCVIPKTEYESLSQLASQYATLCANLLSGGIDQETISVLSQDNTSRHSHEMTEDASEAPTYMKSQSSNPATKTRGPFSSAPKVQRSGGHGKFEGHSHNGYNDYGGHNGDNTREWAGSQDDGFSAEYTPDAHSPEAQQDPTILTALQYDRPHFPRMCKRSILLAGIPEGTTHGEITSIVRGGMILEVYIRAAEHSALVSFLLEEDAVRFYEHARRNDLYINHKRVFIKWADRHYHLSNHVAGKIATGATRNMIIRRCDPNQTEEKIRDHLEHIHNLVVIKIDFIGSSCYIKTNSVHNAMFARTCMMSRATYKSCKIEWDVDECAQPLETPRKVAPPKPLPAVAIKPQGVTMRNRFATLRLDDDDNGDSDDRYDTSTEYTAQSPIGVAA